MVRQHLLERSKSFAMAGVCTTRLVESLMSLKGKLLHVILIQILDSIYCTIYIYIF